ncbi:MAG: SAM-dependent methyltransferase [Candidatus Paceibacteria bacterium]|jgi:SAM-dependent methyltransferase
MQKIDEVDGIREYLKRWSRTYRFIVKFFGPTYLYRTGPENFLKRFFSEPDTSLILNIGSGARTLRQDVTNIDITPYDEVQIVASATDLPLDTATVDGIVCDNVLEHVDEPELAVNEMFRVMKPGAVGYISTPFLYPFHASPYDYQRWTAAGLEHLFKDFSEVEVGVRSGIFSALNVWLCYFLPSLFSFGSSRLYWFLVNLSIFLFFPIKFLDILTNNFPFAKHTAAVFYCIIKK